MTCQIDQGGVIDTEDHKPVGIGKGVIVIPGVAPGIVKLPLSAGHFIHQLVPDEGFKQRARVGVQDHFAIPLHHKKFPLYGRHHLAQREPHGGEIEMKGQAALEFPFRGNDGFENGNRRMVGEIIHIRTGVVAEGAGFRLFDKPGPRSGIESPAVFVFQHLRGAQIVALGIRQRDG